MTKYYAALIVRIDKSGFHTVETFGYTLSEWLRDIFITTCALRIDIIRGNELYAIEFSSINEMYLYMNNTYGYIISGDDRVTTIPVKGILSPYHNSCIVTTLDDVFNSDSSGFISMAENLYIKNDLVCLDMARVRLDSMYFSNEFKAYAKVIELAIAYITKVLTDVIDMNGRIVIDTEKWDVPQYGILKGWYDI